ncbi:HIT family protein [Aquabacterium sp. A7-Y]|uniref:HIT family protein n=1 Tax=Aquabacterium sp. A7-Y TaxID=1349605 RepID=UPI00223CE50F|nr:HIT family protein [Aquabacterium sp. A7-Y]MCW7537320.1 HIT family protein [Aquabacterium sp. A7-Y]
MTSDKQEKENGLPAGTPSSGDCELCRAPGGRLVLQGPRWRVVRVEDRDFPGFWRVIWNAHCAELTDLDAAERHECIEVVAAVEAVVRRRLAPTKINLAALGNMVPHLHWHLIARYDWDSHFPQPIWGARQREIAGGALQRLGIELERVDEELRQSLAPRSK